MAQLLSPLEIPTTACSFGSIGAIRLGLLALSTDLNSETELHRILPADVHLFTQRIRNSNPVTQANLCAMVDHIGDASDLLVNNIDLHAIMYSCTSATLAIGESRVNALCQQGHPKSKVTNPISAVKAAFSQLKARKIHLFTPYSESLHDVFVRHYQQQGFEIGLQHCLNLHTDFDMTSLQPEALAKILAQHYDGHADVLFISCTALRTLSIIAELEKQLGIPVISSAQAMLWHALSLSRPNVSQLAMENTMTALAQYGQLFQHALDVS